MTKKELAYKRLLRSRNTLERASRRNVPSEQLQSILATYRRNLRIYQREAVAEAIAQIEKRISLYNYRANLIELHHVS